MKKSFTRYALFTLAAIGCNHLYAQLLDPNQPEQDACNALLLCGSSFFTPYGYQGVGEVNDMTYTPCGSGEAGSMWLKLIVSSPGSIVFTLTPVDSTDDYDFAVINATNADCDNLSSNDVVRCQFNNNEQPPQFGAYYYGGIIGLNSTSTIQYATAGVNNEEFLQQITANAGDVYLIMVNNYGDDNCTGACPGSGFTIDFTGSTATFYSDGPPEIDSVDYQCEYTGGMKFKMSQPINCASIAPDHSDFYLTPSGNISSVIGTNCNANGQGYTDSIELTFTPPLAPGTYTLHPKVGTDGNTLLNLCGDQMLTSDTFQFSIYPYPQFDTAMVSCSTVTVQLNTPVLCSSIATNGSDMQLSGPEPIYITGVTPVNCANGYTSTLELTLSGLATNAGTYTLTAQTGSDGNTLIGHCDKTQAVGNQVNFYLDPIKVTMKNKLNTICTNPDNGAATVAATGGIPPYTYSVDNTNNFSSDNRLINLSPGQHTVYIKDDIGCQYSDTFSIGTDYHTLVFTADTVSAVCDNNHEDGSITVNLAYNINYIGAQPCTYAWDNYSNNNSATLGDIPAGTYHVTVTDANGCEGDTTVTISEIPCCKVLMPSAFTPNGDGNNDAFKPVSNSDITGYQLAIYNRWGQKIYETTDLAKGWDGKDKGKDAGTDVYFYTLTYTCYRDNQQYKIKGEITLVR